MSKTTAEQRNESNLREFGEPVTDLARDGKGGMQDYIIKRSGRPPIHFKGELIGISSATNPSGEPYQFLVGVKIYRTGGGKFIHSTTYVPREIVGAPDVDAEVHADAKALIAALAFAQDEEESLDCPLWPLQAQEAIENAAENDAAIKAAWIENVD